jgi:hypothetical protein
MGALIHHKDGIVDQQPSTDGSQTAKLELFKLLL